MLSLLSVYQPAKLKTTQTNAAGQWSGAAYRTVGRGRGPVLGAFQVDLTVLAKDWSTIIGNYHLVQ